MLLLGGSAVLRGPQLQLADHIAFYPSNQKLCHFDSNDITGPYRRP